MKYIQIYATNDKFTYDKIISLFKDKSIDYKTLFEYRLLPENNFEIADEGALIKVLQRDYLTANHILITHGYKKQFQSSEFGLVNNLINISSKIPLINNLPETIKLILIIFIAIILLIAGFVIFVLLLGYIFR